MFRGPPLRKNRNRKVSGCSAVFENIVNNCPRQELVTDAEMPVLPENSARRVSEQDLDGGTPPVASAHRCG